MFSIIIYNNNKRLEMQKKFSIIIPVYNTEPFLARCLESAVNQTYSDIEIIVINDASQGNCAEIVGRYTDPRIIYIEQKTNQGTFKARQIATKKATGDYILYLDSDDQLDIKICEYLHSKVYNDPDCILFEMISITKNGPEKTLGANSGIMPFYNHTLFQAVYTRKLSSWMVCGKALKRTLCLQTYDFLNINTRLTMGEDALYFFVFSYFVESVEALHKVGYYYNLTNTSATRAEYTLEKAENDLKNFAFIIEKLKIFCGRYQLSYDILNDTIKEFCFLFFSRAYNLKNDKISAEKIIPQALHIFGSSALAPLIFNQAHFQKDKVRVFSDVFIQKILPINSKRYYFIRKLLLPIYQIFSKKFYDTEI